VLNPDDFGSTFAKGTVSIFTNTVHGGFNSVSKVSGSIGKGLSILTFDRNYIAGRQKDINEKPKDIKDGLMKGGETFAKSLLDGATGIITKPIEGSKDGIGGFFKGIGMGIIGVPVKPVTGLIDFATKTTEGISNVKNYFESDSKGRKRYPRTFTKEGAVTVI
jgi:hypothetical protein